MTPTTDYLLFHTGVRRPVWEDPLNLSGGKWIIRLKKGVSDRLWEDIVLAVLGEQFDDLQPHSSHPWHIITNRSASLATLQSIGASALQAGNRSRPADAPAYLGFFNEDVSDSD